MAHRKPHGGVSKHHLTLGAGGILAAVALISAVALGMSQAQDYSGGGGSYTPPPSGSTYTPPPTEPVPAPAPYVAPTEPAPYVAPTGSTAPAPTGTTQPPPGGCVAPSYWNGTSCASGGATMPPPTGDTHGCVPPGYWNGTTCAAGTAPTGDTHGCVAPQYWDFAKNACSSGTTQTPGSTYPAGTQPTQMQDCGPNVYPTPQNPCRMTTSGSQPAPYGDPSQYQGQQGPYTGGQQNMCGPPPYNCPFGFTSTSPEGGNGCNSYTCNEPPAGFGDFGNFQQPPMAPGLYSGYQGGREGGMNGSMGQSMDPFYGQFSGQQDFSQYQFNFNEEDLGRYEQEFSQKSQREISQETRQFKQEARQLKQEASQISQQLARIAKRSGVYCPAAAEYEAALSTINTAIAVWENVTADNLATAQATRDQVYGSPDNPSSGVFKKLHGYFDENSGEFVQGLDQQIGSCEAAGHAFRELDRLREDIARAIKQADKKGADTADLLALQAEIEAFKASPPADFFAQPDPNECGFGGGGGFGPPMGGPGGGGFGPPMGGPGGGGFGPPMGGPGGGGFGPPMNGGFGGFNGGGFGGFSGGFSEEDMRKMQELQSQFQGGGFDGGFNGGGFQGSVTQEVAQRGMPDFGNEEDFMPSEEELACMPGFARYMMQFGQKFGKLMRSLHEGFESGNICGQIDQMIEMSDQFVDDPRYEEGVAILTAGKTACEAGDLESARKALFKMQRFGGDEGGGDEGFGIDADELLSDQLDDIEDEIERRVAKKFQSLLDEQTKLILALNSQIAELTTQLAAYVSGAVQEQLANVVKAPEDVRTAVLDPVESVVDVYESYVEELPKSIASDVEDLIAELVEFSPPEEIADAIAEHLDGSLTEINAESELSVQRELVNDLEEWVEAAVESVTPEQRVEAGQTSFVDLAENFEDTAKQWYFATVEEAADSGIIQGTANGEAQPGKEMNGCEFLAMTWNGNDRDPVAGATSVAGISGVPTWCAPYAAAVDNELREHDSSLAEVLEGRSLLGPMPRIDVAEITYYVADLEPAPASVLADIRADATLSGSTADEYAAAAAVFEAGIMVGSDGEFHGDDTVLKIEGAAVVSREIEYIAE